MTMIDLLRKNLQLKNKLVESCPRTHLDGFQTARQRKNEIRCPIRVPRQLADTFRSS